MATAFTKHEVGNKQFVIEWNLTGDAMDPVEGEKFELKDCEPISVHSVGPTEVEFRMMLSNHSDPDVIRTFLIINDSFLSPLPDSFGNPPLPPATRWLWPMLLQTESVAKLAVLFREL